MFMLTIGVILLLVGFTLFIIGMESSTTVVAVIGGISIVSGLVLMLIRFCFTPPSWVLDELEASQETTTEAIISNDISDDIISETPKEPDNTSTQGIKPEPFDSSIIINGQEYILKETTSEETTVPEPVEIVVNGQTFILKEETIG